MIEPSQILIFDRVLHRRRRDRAAANFAAHNALFAEGAAQVLERLQDVKRDFAAALDLGAHAGVLAAAVRARGVPFVVAADLSLPMLRQVGDGIAPLAADEEFLPFAPASFDLIVSNLSLHWVNDLPGALVQLRQALRPGGLFLATLLGGATLQELRFSLMEAETLVRGGVSPRLSPTVDLPTASALLQRAGFHLPVADRETLRTVYPDLIAMLRDLRGMGETNAQVQRSRHFTRRQIFTEAANMYPKSLKTADEPGLPATFEFLHLHGWAP